MICAGVLLGVTARGLGPPVGDLTRIGGLSERQFGWTRTAQGFARDYFQRPSLETLLSAGGHGGIVVFGDSFTDAENGNISWLNTLYAKTGADIDYVQYVTLEDVQAYLGAPGFDAAPPDAIIIQMGERTVFRRARPLFDDAGCVPPRPPDALAYGTGDVERMSWRQRTSFADFDELMSWGALAMRRRVLGAGRTVMVELTDSALFTSARSDTLLIYDSEITRHLPQAIAPLDRAAAETGIRCALRHVINTAGDRTEVYVLVAPDKRTVYAPWLANELPEKAVDVHTLLPGALSGRYISLLDLMRSQVRAGVRDVYFPNDTHWNDASAELVGIVVSETILGNPPD